VKYSRVLTTEEFTMVGGRPLTVLEATIIRDPQSETGELLHILSSVSTRPLPTFTAQLGSSHGHAVIRLAALLAAIQ
jgi:hypothetical protein